MKKTHLLPKKKNSVFIFILLINSIIQTNHIYAQILPTYQDSFNGVIKKITSNNIIIVWNDYNCIPCFSVLQRELIKNDYANFTILRLVNSDLDTSWALHLKELYINRFSPVLFNYNYLQSKDSASLIISYNASPFILLPISNSPFYEIIYYKDIFIGTSIRKQFLKRMRRYFKDKGKL